MMVTIGGGSVTVGDAGAGEQDARMIERRETIKVIRGIGELYLNKLIRIKGTLINADLR
jgi:hypothetical protein